MTPNASSSSSLEPSHSIGLILHLVSVDCQRNVISFPVSSTPSLGRTAPFQDQRLRWWRHCGISGGVGGGGPIEDNGLGGWGSDVESARDSFVCVWI